MKIVTSTKKFVARNWGPALGTVAVVSTTIALIQVRAIKEHNSFLKEHDLYDEFYAMDEE